MDPLEDLFRRRQQATQSRQTNRGFANQRMSRWWSPSDALARQPFFGFPGGREPWEHFRTTGELPAGVTMSPEARNFYYNKVPSDYDFTAPTIGGAGTTNNGSTFFTANPTTIPGTSPTTGQGRVYSDPLGVLVTRPRPR